MLPARLRPAARGDASRLVGFGFLVVLTLGLLGCGVPISAIEMTATAENGGGDPDRPVLLSVVTQTSSRAGNVQTLNAQEGVALSLTVTPRPAASATPITTPTAQTAAGTATSARNVTGIPSVATGTPGPPGPSSTPVPGLSLAQQAVKILNDMRVGIGRPALSMNPNLMAGAEAYAKLMAEKDSFSHTGPDGTSPQQRLIASGYRGSFQGEALSAGQGTALEAIHAWRDSPSHAAIVFGAGAVDVGIGYYFDPGDYYGTYWVLMVGAQ